MPNNPAPPGFCRNLLPSWCSFSRRGGEVPSSAPSRAATGFFVTRGEALDLQDLDAAVHLGGPTWPLVPGAATATFFIAAPEVRSLGTTASVSVKICWLKNLSKATPPNLYT